MRERGKEEYQRKEVWEAIDEIRGDLIEICKDNIALATEIDDYFENFEL